MTRRRASPSRVRAWPGPRVVGWAATPRSLPPAAAPGSRPSRTRATGPAVPSSTRSTDPFSKCDVSLSAPLARARTRSARVPAGTREPAMRPRPPPGRRNPARELRAGRRRRRRATRAGRPARAAGTPSSGSAQAAAPRGTVADWRTAAGAPAPRRDAPPARQSGEPQRRVSWSLADGRAGRGRRPRRPRPCAASRWRRRPPARTRRRRRRALSAGWRGERARPSAAMRADRRTPGRARRGAQGRGADPRDHHARRHAGQHRQQERQRARPGRQLAGATPPRASARVSAAAAASAMACAAPGRRHHCRAPAPSSTVAIAQPCEQRGDARQSEQGVPEQRPGGHARRVRAQRGHRHRHHRAATPPERRARPPRPAEQGELPGTAPRRASRSRSAPRLSPQHALRPGAGKPARSVAAAPPSSSTRRCAAQGAQGRRDLVARVARLQSRPRPAKPRGQAVEGVQLGVPAARSGALQLWVR